ncbi:adenosylcobinamide amidohydrolase [Methanomicrobium mobile]|uniref:adenosylcobinamide amidohydrolase n=1 Tax=Methanomicrobium mobile TaxID=2205 RepID=UPI0005B2A946|nr:adenosylcobinamide amidohydrolase [Methanomicrobium mobile]
MRYTVKQNTLFIRGNFRAASTGVGGGIGNVATVFNHTVPMDFNHDNPQNYLNSVAKDAGFGDDFYGLLTAVSMKNLCIFTYGYITVFVTAGAGNPNPDVPEIPASSRPRSKPESERYTPHTINIIVHSRELFTDSALLETIITATEAKADALSSLGRDYFGTTTDEVVVICDRADDESANTPADTAVGGGVAAGVRVHEYAGTLTDCGSKVYLCVKNGVIEALKRHEGDVSAKEPSFFVVSTMSGLSITEWRPYCEFYPCHFRGQSCKLCYCPFYPCGDEELGDLITSSDGSPVWSCKRCLLNHYKEVANFILDDTDVAVADAKAFAKARNLRLTEK